MRETQEIKEMNITIMVDGLERSIQKIKVRS
jgi:hypothetical protein